MNTFVQLSKQNGWDTAFEHLHRRDREWLYSPVKEGHNELFRTCCILRTLGIDDAKDAAMIVAARWSTYNRMPEPREFEDAWTASEGAVQDEEGVEYVKRPRVHRDEDLIRRVLATSPVNVEVVKKASPIPYDTLVQSSSRKFILSLFPRNSLICLGATASRACVSHLEVAAGKAATHPLIVPSPMTSTRGTNKRGNLTPRCLDNTGPRMYAVTEFDHGVMDDQSKLIVSLNDEFPGKLKMILWSGSKSLHAWWRINGDEALADDLFDRAISLGADPATRVKCQFVRTPNATRDTGNVQQVIFYDK